MGSSEEVRQVVVVGAGPAGRVLGVLLARRGVDVVVVDPAPGKGFVNTYGVWADEVEGLEVDLPVRCRFGEALVRLGDEEKRLKREYLRVDREAFCEGLDGELGARLVEGSVVGVRRSGAEVWVELESGEEIGAVVVVDASGGKAGLCGEIGVVPGVQTAFGIEARCVGDPLDGAEMVLMDYGEIEGAIPSPAPTFLYGMRLGEDRYFLEETVLVARPAVGVEVLAERLWARLEALGVEVVEIYEEERCWIPMGTDLPPVQGGVVAFGASAGVIHPATGYQLARTLGMAGAVADVIAAGVEAGESGQEIVRGVWAVVWPEEVARGRELLRFGQEVLLGLDGEGTRRFFDVFFGLPQEDWRAYLSGGASHRRVAQVMWRLFGEASMEMRWGLARRALVDGGGMWRALLKSSAGRAGGAVHG